MSGNGNWGSIILVTILLIAGGAAYAYSRSSQNPDGTFVDQTLVDASTWQTYSDQQFGFSFKYPNTFQVISGSVMNDAGGPVEVINIVQKGNSGYSYGMNVTVRNKADANYLKDGLGNVMATENIDPNGIPMTVYDSRITVSAQGQTNNGTQTAAIFTMGNYAYSVNMTDAANFAPDFYTILSTFQSQ